MVELINKKEYERDNKRIAFYFNQVIGVLVFTITLTCLSFETPQRAALFSLPIVLALLSLAPKGNELWLVRKLIDEHDNEDEKKELKKELKDFIKADSGVFKSLKQVPIYYYGTMFYIVVLTVKDFGIWFRT